jgi:hypothetical protein
MKTHELKPTIPSHLQGLFNHILGHHGITMNEVHLRDIIEVVTMVEGDHIPDAGKTNGLQVAKTRDFLAKQLVEIGRDARKHDGPMMIKNQETLAERIQWIIEEAGMRDYCKRLTSTK